ncbi:hypothetical protein PR048_005588 [Dryococelus australis]|uniref:Uncharacterized protein n=1 Tax=Dryococelus australis TaxID=614101 RepID=A0ABQ9I8K4_9NEOP|nr:hypothetical protein PR048_005588 [Dryococelus australis]
MQGWGEREIPEKTRRLAESTSAVAYVKGPTPCSPGVIKKYFRKLKPDRRTAEDTTRHVRPAWRGGDGRVACSALPRQLSPTQHLVSQCVAGQVATQPAGVNALAPRGSRAHEPAITCGPSVSGHSRRSVTPVPISYPPARRLPRGLLPESAAPCSSVACHLSRSVAPGPLPPHKACLQLPYPNLLYSECVNVTSLDAKFRTRPRPQVRPIVDRHLHTLLLTSHRSFQVHAVNNSCPHISIDASLGEIAVHYPCVATLGNAAVARLCHMRSEDAMTLQLPILDLRENVPCLQIPGRESNKEPLTQTPTIFLFGLTESVSSYDWIPSWLHLISAILQAGRTTGLLPLHSRADYSLQLAIASFYKRLPDVPSDQNKIEISSCRENIAGFAMSTPISRYATLGSIPEFLRMGDVTCVADGPGTYSSSNFLLGQHVALALGQRWKTNETNITVNKELQYKYDSGLQEGSRNYNGGRYSPSRGSDLYVLHGFYDDGSILAPPHCCRLFKLARLREQVIEPRARATLFCMRCRHHSAHAHHAANEVLKQPARLTVSLSRAVSFDRGRRRASIPPKHALGRAHVCVNCAVLPGVEPYMYAAHALSRSPARDVTADSSRPQWNHVRSRTRSLYVDDASEIHAGPAQHGAVMRDILQGKADLVRKQETEHVLFSGDFCMKRFGTIPTCENPGVTRLGIELRSPWWQASRLTAQPPLPRECEADLPWHSRLVRHRSGVREALGSNPGQGMDPPQAELNFLLHAATRNEVTRLLQARYWLSVCTACRMCTSPMTRSEPLQQFIDTIANPTSSLHLNPSRHRRSPLHVYQLQSSCPFFSTNRQGMRRPLAPFIRPAVAFIEHRFAHHGNANSWLTHICPGQTPGHNFMSSTDLTRHSPRTLQAPSGEISYNFVGGSGSAAPILADQQARPADVRRGDRQTHLCRSEDRQGMLRPLAPFIRPAVTFIEHRFAHHGNANSWLTHICPGQTPDYNSLSSTDLTRHSSRTLEVPSGNSPNNIKIDTNYNKSQTQDQLVTTSLKLLQLDNKLTVTIWSSHPYSICILLSWGSSHAHDSHVVKAKTKNEGLFTNMTIIMCDGSAEEVDNAVAIGTKVDCTVGNAVVINEEPDSTSADPMTNTVNDPGEDHKDSDRLTGAIYEEEACDTARETEDMAQEDEGVDQDIDGMFHKGDSTNGKTGVEVDGTAPTSYDGSAVGPSHIVSTL